MDKNIEKPSLIEAQNAVKKILNLNDLFLDSVKFNQCECFEKYQYVSLEFGRQIWILIQYLNIEF